MRRLAAERERRRLRAGGGRAPRTREAGVAVRAHYGALPSMAGRGTGMGGKPYPPRPRKHGPRSEIAAVARRKALRDPASSPTARRTASRLPFAPFGALPPSWFRGENHSSPRAHRATRMRELGCLKFTLCRSPHERSDMRELIALAQRPHISLRSCGLRL